MQRSRSLQLLILTTVALAGCSDSPNRPMERRLEGTYRATVFSVETPDTVFDQLTQHTSIGLTLNSDGTTSGAFLVADLATDLAGQWDTVADTLRLHLGTPTFLGRIPLAIAPNQLSGKLHLQDGTFHLTLAR